MTTPPQLPLPYSTADAQLATDLSHLKVISICHYVWGALTCAFSSIFIIHIVLGAVMVSGKMNFPTTGPNAANSPPGPPPEFGWLFVGMGSCAVLLGWTLGLLTIYSGRCIAKQHKRMFSVVIAALNCMSFPFGTVLGVFTLIVLLRESVKRIYGEVTSIPTAYWPPPGTQPPQ